MDQTQNQDFCLKYLLFIKSVHCFARYMFVMSLCAGGPRCLRRFRRDIAIRHLVLHRQPVGQLVNN